MERVNIPSEKNEINHETVMARLSIDFFSLLVNRPW